MQPLARQREFSRDSASPLREPPSHIPRVLSASPSTTALSVSGRRAQLRVLRAHSPHQPPALRLGHTLKMRSGRLALGPARGPLLAAASPFTFLSPRGHSDSVQGQRPSPATAAGSALRVWL